MPADALDELLTSLNSDQPSPRARPSSPSKRGTGAPSPDSPEPMPTGDRGGDAPVDERGTGTTARGFADMASFGLADEVGGFFQTLGLTNSHEPRETVWDSEGSFSSLLSRNIARNRQQFADDQEDRPGHFLGGNLIGAVLVPLGSGAKGALQVAKVGAAQGAAYGAGSGEGLGDRVVKAGEYAVGGGVFGAALGKIAPVVGRGVRRLLGRSGDDASRAAEGVADEPLFTDTEAGWTQASQQGDRQPVVMRAAEEAEDELVPLTADPNDLEGRVTDDSPALGGAASEAAPIGSISRAGLDDLQAQVDAFRMRVGSEGDRAVDLPEGAAQGAFRLGNLGDGPDTMSLLGALVRQLPAKEARSDIDLMRVAQAASDEIGAQDPEAVFALAEQIAGKLGDADTSMAVLRTVVRRAADTIEQFHGAGIDWSTATDEMVQEVGQAIYNSQRLNSLLMSAKIGVGRGLRTIQLPDADSYLQALARGERIVEPMSERSIPPLPSNRQELSDFFELWGLAKNNPEMQADLLSGSLSVPTSGHYLAHSFANFFTASILSAPKTLVLNLMGPSVVNVVRSLEKTGGGALGAVNPFATAAERRAQAEVAKNTPLALIATIGQVKDVFRYGVQAFMENRAVLGGGGTVRDANITFGPYNSNLIHAAGLDPNWAQRGAYALGNTLNIFPKALARVNAGLDELSKRFSYLNEVRVRAMVEAAGQGLSGDEARSYVAQVMKSSVDEAGLATSESLLRAAERSTLTAQPSAEGTLGRKLTDFVQTLRHDYPLTRFVLPVFTVPANAIGETMRRIPLYNRMPWMVEHAADLAGKNGAVSQAEAHGRSLLGGSFLMAGYLMNQAGLLTGAGPQEPTDRKIWLQTHQPYSIRIGDQWVSYRKLDILGGLLSIPATLSDVTVYSRADNRTLTEASLVGVASLATWFKDAGAMRTATEFLTLGDDPTQDPAATMERIAGQIAAGMVPASGFVRSLGVDTQDPYSRLKEDWDDYIRAGLPGLSQEMEPLRNVLGEPINRPANSLAEAVFPVTFAPVATYRDEPVLDELTRLYQVTGYGAGADPRALLYGFGDPQEVKLEDGRSLYFHAMQARATMRLDGMTLKESLAELINTPEYNEGVDGDASQRETSRGDLSRAYMVRSVFDRFNKAIKAELGASSPTALRYLTAAAAKQRDDAYLRTISIDDLADNPDLYQARGIDPVPYSDAITDGAAGDLLEALGQ